jgi:RNA polymerase sigma-70 factor (ECF subfamily)
MLPVMLSNPIEAPNERDLLAALSERYRASLRRYFARRIRTPVDAEDLIQEVFLRLTRRGDFRSIEHIGGYLFTVAANVLQERLRYRQSRGIELHDEYREDLHAIEVISPERVLIGRQSVARVAQALRDLPESVRTAFVLHRFEGMHQPQIAQRLGVSVSAVEKYIARALVHIKQRMDEAT